MTGMEKDERHMTQAGKPSWIKRIRKAFLGSMLVLMLVTGMTAAPVRPAHAVWCNIDFLNFVTDAVQGIVNIWNKIKEVKWLKDIYDALVAFYDGITEVFGWIFEKIPTISKIIVEGKKIQAEIEKRIMNAKIEADYFDRTILAPGMGYVMEKHLLHTHEPCKKIFIHQKARTAEEFKARVKVFADDILMSTNRLATDSSVAHAVNMQSFRCLYGIGSPLDGYPSDCMDFTSGADEGPAHRLLTDMDLSPYTLDGSIRLELPEMKSEQVEINGQKVAVSVPDPKNYNQKAWVAGLGFCLHMMETRPVPVADKTTHKGLADFGTFKWGSALQGEYNSACTELLAEQTRPTNGDKELEELIAEENKACEVLKEGAGAFTEAEVEEQFDNCKKGLSPYQLALIEHTSCFGSNPYIAQSMALAPDLDIMKSAMSCMTAWTDWQTDQLNRFGALIDAAEGQQKIKSIWAQMDNGGGDYETAFNNKGTPGVFTLVLEKRRKEAAERKKMEKEGLLISDEGPLPRGKPLYADEQALPVAVSQ